MGAGGRRIGEFPRIWSDHEHGNSRSCFQLLRNLRPTATTDEVCGQVLEQVQRLRTVHANLLENIVENVLGRTRVSPTANGRQSLRPSSRVSLTASGRPRQHAREHCRELARPPESHCQAITSPRTAAKWRNALFPEYSDILLTETVPRDMFLLVLSPRPARRTKDRVTCG